MKHEHHKKPVHHKAKAAEELKKAPKPKASAKPKAAPKPKLAPAPKPVPVIPPEPITEPVPAPLPTYMVAAIAAGPDPDDEQLFIVTEREHVTGVLSNWRGGLFGSFFGSAGPGREDWERYQRELDVYEHVIDRFELDMVDGLVPFRIVVKNLLAEADRDIAVAIHVAGGSILLSQKLPVRPVRPAGPQHVSERSHINLFSGFARRHVRLGPQTMSAEFSKLAGGDSADLVNETLFLFLSPETVISYALSSANRPEESGYIAL